MDRQFATKPQFSGSAEHYPTIGTFPSIVCLQGVEFGRLLFISLHQQPDQSEEISESLLSKGKHTSTHTYEL
jgi:hypothetical protein